MKRNWIKEKVYNHLGNEVRLCDNFYTNSELYWSGMEILGSYLDLRYYEFLTLSERLVMSKISMMYRGRKGLYGKDKLEYLIEPKSILDIPQIHKCKSWKSLCSKVQMILQGHTEVIDEQYCLMNAIIKFIKYEFGSNPSYRNDLVWALRLYYIMGYDRSELYNRISEIDLPYKLDGIKDSIICTLKLLKLWKYSYLYYMTYETTRILMVEDIDKSLILKELGSK